MKQLIATLLFVSILIVHSLAAIDPRKGQTYPGEYQEAAEHMKHFQEALLWQQWQDALAMCSDRVRTNAAEWASPETFFRETVPLDKLISQQFEWWLYNSNKYGLVINLTPPEAEPVVQWFWAIYMTNKTWVADFEPIKLADYITKKKAAGQAREDKLREMRQGMAGIIHVKVHLKPLSPKFVLGSPMLFQVSLRNFETVVDRHGPNSAYSGPPILERTGTPIHYQDNGVAFHPLTVLNESKQPVPAQEQPKHVLTKTGRVEPGRAVILGEVDITKDHKITAPGKYYVQFSGEKLQIGQPLPPQQPARSADEVSLWPMTFVAVLAQFPSEIIEIEVVEK